MSDSNLAPPHHTIVAPLIAELGQFIADWACNTECSFDLSAVTTALDTIKSLDENNTDSLNTHKDIVQAYQEQWDTLHKVAYCLVHA